MMGMFNLVNKITAWAGTLMFTVVNETTRSMRLGLLLNGIWFVLAVGFLWVRVSS